MIVIFMKTKRYSINKYVSFYFIEMLYAANFNNFCKHQNRAVFNLYLVRAS